MIRSIRSRRTAAIAPLIILSLILSGPTYASAHLYSPHPPNGAVCENTDWKSGPEAVERLIRCAARTWRVPGGPDKAVAVAFCESRLDPTLRSESGTYVGVFQQSLRYWADRARIYGFPGAPATDGRANIIVSIRMVHVGGWSPWSCA